MLQFLIRLQNVDRRYIFAAMAVSIFFPLLFPGGCETKIRVDKPVQAIYDVIEALPPGSTVMVSANMDPASKPELMPFIEANLEHLFRNKHKVIVTTLWPYAPGVILPALRSIGPEMGAKEGEDWTFLGYKDGKELAMKQMAENMRQAFPVDYFGNPIDDIPVMDGVQSMQDLALLIDYSAGYPGTKEWVIQVQGQYNIPMISSCTAVQITDYVPYYQAGQLLGLAGGMPGSAQYEHLVGRKGLATQGMLVLNYAHLFIIFAIILGNISYLLARRFPDEV